MCPSDPAASPPNPTGGSHRQAEAEPRHQRRCEPAECAGSGGGVPQEHPAIWAPVRGGAGLCSVLVEWGVCRGGGQGLAVAVTSSPVHVPITPPRISSLVAYICREVIILLAALSTCDPGDIAVSIRAAKQHRVRVSGAPPPRRSGGPGSRHVPSATLICGPAASPNAAAYFLQ